MRTGFNTVAFSLLGGVLLATGCANKQVPGSGDDMLHVTIPSPFLPNPAQFGGQEGSEEPIIETSSIGPSSALNSGTGMHTHNAHTGLGGNPVHKHYSPIDDRNFWDLFDPDRHAHSHPLGEGQPPSSDFPLWKRYLRTFTP